MPVQEQQSLCLKQKKGFQGTKGDRVGNLFIGAGEEDVHIYKQVLSIYGPGMQKGKENDVLNTEVSSVSFEGKEEKCCRHFVTSEKRRTLKGRTKYGCY